MRLSDLSDSFTRTDRIPTPILYETETCLLDSHAELLAESKVLEVSNTCYMYRPRIVRLLQRRFIRKAHTMKYNLVSLEGRLFLTNQRLIFVPRKDKFSWGFLGIISPIINISKNRLYGQIDIPLSDIRILKIYEALVPIYRGGLLIATKTNWIHRFVMSRNNSNTFYNELMVQKNALGDTEKNKSRELIYQSQLPSGKLIVNQRLEQHNIFWYRFYFILNIILLPLSIFSSIIRLYQIGIIFLVFFTMSGGIYSIIDLVTLPFIFFGDIIGLFPIDSSDI